TVPANSGQGVCTAADGATAPAAGPAPAAGSASSLLQAPRATTVTHSTPPHQTRIAADGELMINPPGTAQCRRPSPATTGRKSVPRGPGPPGRGRPAQETHCAADNGWRNRVRASLRNARHRGAPT